MNTIDTLVLQVRAASARYQAVKAEAEEARRATRRADDELEEAAENLAVAQEQLLARIAEDT